MKRRCVVSRASGVSASASCHELRLQVSLSSEIVAYQSISVCDEDHGCTRVDVCFEKGADVIVVASVSSLTAGVTYRVSDAIYLPGEWRLLVRFYGTTLGDKLRVLALGYVVDDGG
jgi:hypothetical protein